MQAICNVICLNCNHQVSSRGCNTVLRADRQIKIISSDYKTKNMEQSESSRIFDKCPCKIKDFHCSNCKEYLGYHVVEPCLGCKRNNNGHYYVFRKARSEETELTWDKISPIYKEEDTFKVEKQLPEELSCPICMQIMSHPTIILCGHTFCKSCIERHVDLKANCPLDIKPMSREGPFIPNRLAQTLIHQALKSKETVNS